jgi:hypothetical protein
MQRAWLVCAPHWTPGRLWRAALLSAVFADNQLLGCACALLPHILSLRAIARVNKRKSKLARLRVAATETASRQGRGRCAALLAHGLCTLAAHSSGDVAFWRHFEVAQQQAFTSQKTPARARALYMRTHDMHHHTYASGSGACDVPACRWRVIFSARTDGQLQNGNAACNMNGRVG